MMNFTFRNPEGTQTMTPAQLAAKVKEIVAACPSEITCAYRVWYEGIEGYGRPTAALVAAIEEAIVAAGGWTAVGPRRFEKYGAVNAFTNDNYAAAAKEKNGEPMILHKFKTGSKWQGPDGKIWWIPVVEVFDMRCFEWDGEKYIGEMVEINPNSDYAKAMVEVK